MATIGDSLTRGGMEGTYQSFTRSWLSERGMQVIVENHGISGQLVHQITSRIDSVLHADIIVFMAGTNDVWHFSTVSGDIGNEIVHEIVTGIEKAIACVENVPGGPPPRLIICTIPPVAEVPFLSPSVLLNIDRANRQILTTCKTRNVRCCDVNRAMREPKSTWACRSLVGTDGIHFTSEGNKLCGIQIARCISTMIEGSLE